MDLDRLLATLRDVVGAAHVVTDPSVTEGQVVDWSGRFRGATPAVVRPADTPQVAAVVAACNEARQTVVAQGGNTGLVGGGVPLHGELLVDLRRLDALAPVDRRAGQVTAQAGVTIGALQAHARAAGWAYGIDLGARDSATVGGTIATNAGGVHVVRYGPTRRQVVGIEAVLADGRIISRLEGLEKDNTGDDLAGLVCGSEGTLAIVTAARLRLVPLPPNAATALLAFDAVDDALDAVGELRRSLDSLQAVELFFADGLDLVCEQLALPSPFDAPHTAFVLVEVAVANDPVGLLASACARLGGVADTVVADDTRRRHLLWRYREGHPEAINRLGAPHKLDVTLPASAMGEFVATVGARVADVAPHARTWLFGHAADGNLHVNLTGLDPDDETADDAVLRFVADLRGSISAEHGIGTAKRRWLPLVRSPAEIETMRAIKRALDPRGILNPHVLFPSVAATSTPADAAGG
jgi:FAD/FMN-containing dehydrogenase